MHNPPHHHPFDMRGAVNLLYVLVSGHATCVTPFVRRNFGREALGRNGAVAFVILFFYMAAYPRHFVVQQFTFWWFVMFILQRLKTMYLVSRGLSPHSRYDGYPYLGYLLPFVKDPKGASIIEFLALLGGGMWLSTVDAPLGKLIIVSSVCLVVKNAIDEDIVRRRLQSMRDAEIEQRVLLDRYRRGDF
ncbi:MAG TPA: hypothetical protein VGN12_27935 [Pirellulales bacterium]|jgi:hypothetical protein